jgi:hypothetical protein
VGWCTIDSTADNVGTSWFRFLHLLRCNAVFRQPLPRSMDRTKWTQLQGLLNWLISLLLTFTCGGHSKIANYTPGCKRGMSCGMPLKQGWWYGTCLMSFKRSRIFGVAGLC